MTARPKDRRKPLQLFILLGLLILTKELEVRGQEDESTALHRLRGRSGWEFPAEPSRMSDQLFLHSDEEHFERRTMDACPPGFSEISRRENFHRTIRQENSIDPGHMKSQINESRVSEVHRNTEEKRLDGNSTTEFQQSFIQERLIHDQQIDPQRDEPDSASWDQSPQRAADPIPQFDHQQILMLQDDPVVQSAAAYLHDKHPSVSSLHVLQKNQTPEQVKGEAAPLSENSSLVLVGHGARDASGQMRISGFTYRDVARIIRSFSRTAHRIRTTTLVACDVGSDEQFVEDLLHKLHKAGIQTELHPWKTVVQVTESGQIISQEVSPDGPQWRHEDSTKKVVVTVGRNGEVTRRTQSAWKGEAVFTNSTNFLKPPTDRQNYRNCWPEEPRTFIDPKVYEKFDQNKVEQIKEAFKILESLSWGLFHPEQPTPQRVDVNMPGHFILRQRSGSGNNIKFTWINEEQKVKDELSKCFVINSGTDIRNIIRHYAKDGENGDTYLMVNSWIFLIDYLNLYVFPAGKQLVGEEDPQQLREMIESQGEGSESYANLRGNIQGNDRNNYGFYVKNIFQGQPVSRKLPATEPERSKFLRIEFFYTWYFTASCITESARNFRTFPLVLMALWMDDNHIEGRPDFWFNQHPMARGGSWSNECSRGFSGSAAPSIKDLSAAQREKLVEVLRVEYLEFHKWKEAVLKHCETYGCTNLEFIELKAMAKMSVKYQISEEADIKTFIANCKTFLGNVKK